MYVFMLQSERERERRAFISLCSRSMIFKISNNLKTQLT